MTEKTPMGNKLDAIMDDQVHHEVEWKDADDNPHTTKTTLEDPGIDVATHAIDLLNTGNDTGDFGDLFGIVMDKVQISPRYTYEGLNKALSAKEQVKTITKKNKKGESVKLTMHFPGYEDALQIMMMSQRPSGGSNVHDTLDALNSKIFRNAKGGVVKMSYWDRGGAGYGLGMTALQEGLSFLGDILAKDGVLPILTDSFQFLIKTVSTVKPEPLN